VPLGRVSSLGQGPRLDEEGLLVFNSSPSREDESHIFPILGLLLGYSFVGFVCYLVMVALGEMASFLPHKKGFAGYATRFADPALGFALGWNYLLKYVRFPLISLPYLYAESLTWLQWIVTPNNINAAGVVVQYWTTSVHIAVWMGMCCWYLCFILVDVSSFSHLHCFQCVYNYH
jgi:amino acid transporter